MADTNGHTLRAAVIGTGKISEEHLRFLSSEAGVKLVGVCDLSSALAKFSASRFASAHAFTDAAQMLETANPDVVHVCTPAQTHVKIVSQCLEAGCHVIVEKPIALNNADFRKLWDLAQQRDRCLVEDHNYRFNEGVRE